MRSENNPFIPPLGKLALSLGASDSSDEKISPQLSQRRQICIVTLLRIIDNILEDPDQINPKLRKIKVSNPAFQKRCGQWDGSIDYLLQCGFKMKGNSTSNNNNSSRHLRLDVEDHDMLLFGREMLVQFAVLTLGVEETSLPKCPPAQKMVNNNEMNESHIGDDAKLGSAVKPNTIEMNPKTVSSAPTVDDDGATLKVPKTAQNEVVGEHSISPVVSDKTDDINVEFHRAQATESPAYTSLPTETEAVAVEDEIPSLNSQRVKEVEEKRTQNTDEKASESNVDDMMTDLLNEIEAELNDDFFSTTAEEGKPTLAQDAMVVMSSDENNAQSQRYSIDSSQQKDLISVKSSESISNIDDDETDDLAMAIAMSLAGPDSYNDSSDDVRDKSNNNKSLSQHGEDSISPSQQIDLEQQPTTSWERSVATQSSDTDKITSDDPLLTTTKIVVSTPVNSTANDKEDNSCKGSDEVVEQQHLGLQTDSEPDIESTMADTSHDDSRISAHNNDRTSLLRTSISSVKTLQTKNTSAQHQDDDEGGATIVKKDEATFEVDKPPAAAEDEISQSHDVQSDYNNVFRKIPIPEGEYYASSNDKDAEAFRLGFELCHRAVLSVWPQSKQAQLSGVSNLKRWKKDKPNGDDLDPVILIPLHLVYAVWTCILELQSKTSLHSRNNECRSQSGSMYSWIVSNNKELSKLGGIPMTKLSMNIHTNLSESNLSVCNYVLNALRDIEVIDIYGGNVIESDTTFFVGVERRFCEEYTNKHQDGILLSEPIIKECHAILARVVYPTVLDQLSSDDTASKNNCDQTLLWYAIHHAPRHLMAVPRISDAKEMLLNCNFAQARVDCMGYLEGTKQHCRDCADLANCLSRSEHDWRRLQLHSTDTKEDECAMSPEDYNDHCCSQQAPELPEWTESRVKALCAVSNILREKIGKISECNENEKVEVGNSLQIVGEAIGDIGIYCVVELEHYDEALQLKSEALGGKHEEVADTLFAMGCHHQRFQHSAIAQKCYEQALAIYKARLGYDDPRVSRVLHNIGVMYHSKKQNSVAMKCFMKSLSIRKATLGDDDISVAESHCWIGNLLRENEEFEAARQSFLAAHQIKSLALGNDHVECAEILHNLGVVCDDLGLYSESLASFREALLIRKANVSSAYDVNATRDICDTLNCIANVYRAKMDRQRALQFFEQSLSKRARIVSSALSNDEQVKILLSTYEDVIALMKVELKESAGKREITEKIGSLLVEMALLYDHRLNKQRKALTYYQRSLQVFKHIKDLKKIGQVLSQMASIHVKNDDNQKALKCFRDALVLQKKSQREESLEMADTLHSIGNCEAKEGEFEKCLETYDSSLRIKKNILPEEHASIAKTEHCIGLAQIQAGNFEKALGYFLSSIKARRSLLGNHHLDVSFSLHSIGRIYFYQGKYEKAIECVEEALKIKENAFHERHISLAETQHLLGSLLIKKGDFSSAISLLKAALITYKDKTDCEVLKSDVLDLLATAYMKEGDDQFAILSLEQSLKIKTNILGPDDLACANVLMTLGKLKAKKENLDGALVAFKEVKRIQKQVYGKDHLKNAELLIEVAAIQNQLGNSDMAFRCYTEALRIRRSQLYINSPEIAEALVSVGKIHQSNDDNISSMECFEEAAAIYSKKQNCPELADVYYLLGTSQIATGDTMNGLSSLEKCLQSRGMLYGTNSDDWAEVAYDVGVAKLEADTNDGVLLLEKFVRIARTSERISPERLSNALVKLGQIYRKTRSVDEAMELFDEALKMQNEDENELWMSEVMFHKGSIFECRKQYVKSLACYEESLQLRKSVAGEDEVTADTMKRVGEIHRLRGSYDQSIEQFESALDVYRMTVGNDHESVADTLHCLGYIHDSKNDSDKALSYHKEAWNVRKAIFGKDHVKVASSLDDIARIYQKLGDNVKAIRCLKEALRVRKLTLGNEDIEVATTLFGLGICCAAINETQKAMECYNRALEISAFDGSNPKLEAQALHQIGCVHASACSYRDALQSWRTSLSKYREAGLADDHYMVACTLGNIEMAENVLSSG